jgi:DNA modification methylase
MVKQMSNLNFEYWNTDKLVDYIRNPRRNDQVISRMVASINEFGFTIPILAQSDGLVIDGHLRLKAARELKLATVPVVIADHLTESQVKVFRLLANRSANWAEWDDELLKIELSELKSSDFNLELTGFDAKELDALLIETPDVIEDDAEAVVDKIEECQQKWQVQLGDMFQCGNHRLLCGDSTNAEDVARVLMEDKPNLMVTDPPYGVDYDPAWRDEAAKHCESMGNRKDTAKGVVKNDNRSDWSEAWALYEGDVAYVWCAPGSLHCEVHDTLVSNNLIPRNMIIWNKSHFVIGRGSYHQKHEPLWYCVRKDKTAHYIGDRKQTTVWDIAKPQKNDTGHSTQKPIECMARPIRNHESEFVYEPFCGSGTTIIACEQLGRKCLAIELNPSYCSVILERWSQLTGQEPMKL